MEHRSLYDRLGGKEAVVAVVEDFVARAAGDSRINAKFARTDVPRLKAMLVEQVCAASGGPVTYSGRGMRQTHDGMGVTAGEFDALVADLVEVESPATGTPLPSSYEPAAPVAGV